MIVYLAGPINGCSDSEANDWRTTARSMFDAVLDPMDRDYRGQEDTNAHAIVTGDRADIRACDAVVANCARPSWGTAMEIMFAYELGKPVVAIVPDCPVSPWLQYHARVVTTLTEARIVLAAVAA